MNQPRESVDVLCVGQASFDIIMNVDHHPGEDEKCVASALQTSGGGPAANASVAVCRLGGTSAFCGYIGTDPYGHAHLDELILNRVNTAMVVRGSFPSPVSVILVKPGGFRTVVNYRSGTPEISGEQFDLSMLSLRVVLFDGHEPAAASIVLANTQRVGIPTVLDAGSVHKGTLMLADKVDYLIASEKFAIEFTREEDPHKALCRLKQLSPCAAITLGKRGVIWDSGQGHFFLPAHNVTAVDSTGAGDTFHGAFALSIARGSDVEAAIRFSAAAAALCCTRVGARTGIPYVGEVDEVLRSEMERS